MVRVEILPVSDDSGNSAFHAAASGKHAVGRTVGEAFDRLAAQLPEDDATTLVIVQRLLPDRFFGVEQRRRLERLMERWRAARDAGSELPTDERDELDALIDEEIRASARRTAAMLDELGR